MPYLFVSFYRPVPPAPVLHGLPAAEALHTVGGAREVESGPGQLLRGHLLGHLPVPERVHAAADVGPVQIAVRLQLAVGYKVSHF